MDGDSPALVLFVDIEHVCTLRVEDVSAEGRKDGTTMEERKVIGGEEVVNEVFDDVYAKRANHGNCVGFGDGAVTEADADAMGGARSVVLR